MSDLPLYMVPRNTRAGNPACQTKNSLTVNPSERARERESARARDICIYIYIYTYS